MTLVMGGTTYAIRTAKQLDPNRVVVEVNSGLGGRAAILARGNKYLNIHSKYIINFLIILNI